MAEKRKSPQGKKSERKLEYKTDLNVDQMIINKSVMSIKVPTIVARKVAQRELNKAIDQGITPYYVKKETWDRLSGTHFE